MSLIANLLQYQKLNGEIVALQKRIAEVPQRIGRLTRKATETEAKITKTSNSLILVRAGAEATKAEIDALEETLATAQATQAANASEYKTAEVLFDAVSKVQTDLKSKKDAYEGQLRDIVAKEQTLANLEIQLKDERMKAAPAIAELRKNLVEDQRKLPDMRKALEDFEKSILVSGYTQKFLTNYKRLVQKMNPVVYELDRKTRDCPCCHVRFTSAKLQEVARNTALDGTEREGEMNVVVCEYCGSMLFSKKA